MEQGAPAQSSQNEAGTPASHFNEGFPITNWDDLKVRHAFVRKVFLVFTIQMSIAFGFAVIFVYLKDPKEFMRHNYWTIWVSLAVYLIMHTWPAFYNFWRKLPWNLLALALFTLSFSYVAAATGHVLATINEYLHIVTIIIGMQFLFCLSMVIFSLQTRWAFTTRSGLGLVFISALATFTIVSITFQDHVLYNLIVSFVASFYTSLSVLKMQLVLEENKLSIRPDEYIFAALVMSTGHIEVY